MGREESTVLKLGSAAPKGPLGGHVEQELWLGSGALDGFWEGGDGLRAVSTKIKVPSLDTVWGNQKMAQPRRNEVKVLFYFFKMGQT